VDLTRSPFQDEDDDTTSPLAAVANWADEIRQSYPWTTKLHYINIDEDAYDDHCAVNSPDCTFVYERDCVEDACVAGSIVNYTQRLYDGYHAIKEQDGAVMHPEPAKEGGRGGLRGSAVTSYELKNSIKESLMFVVHFVGDVHQPLHCSRASDEGGNSIKVTFHEHAESSSSSSSSDRVVEHSHKSHSGTNLHAVWDSRMIERSISDDYQSSQSKFTRSILLSIESEYMHDVKDSLRCPSGLDTKCTTYWAKETVKDALDVAYPNEHGIAIKSGDLLSDTYHNQRIAVVKKKLAIAGVRLAAILEMVLGEGGAHYESSADAGWEEELVLEES